MTDLLSEALAWQQAGASVVPCRNDGTKAPLGSWTKFMTAPASGDQVVDWFAGSGYDGMGLVCGSVSGNLEMLEWEGRAVAEGLVQSWLQAMSDHGHAELAALLLAGYVEQTPSGGWHVLYRVDGAAARNTRLAMRPSTDAELAARPEAKVQVLLETRGEGGYVVIAPSSGRATERDGGAWTVLVGSAESVPVLTETQRDALHAVARLLDQMPEVVAPEIPRAVGPATTPDVGSRPGDDYNARADWRDILEPHGWVLLRRIRGNELGWQRPGKGGDSISATTGANEADNLFVFSSSTSFPQEEPISKFQAYALLEHAGDHGAAARRLRGEGYGGERPALGDGARYQRDLAETASLVSYDPTPTKPRKVPRPSGLHHDEQPLVTALLGPVDDNPGHQTQLALARRMADGQSGSLRFVHGLGWHIWDTTRWAPDETGEARRITIATVEAAYADLGRITDADEKKRTFVALRKLERNAEIEGILKLSESLLPLATAVKALNVDPYLLNTRSGTLDLRTRELLPHDQGDLLTKVTGCGYDPDAKGPVFEQFLKDIQPDPEMRDYLARILGHALVGRVVENVLPIFIGEGQNGKSTLIDVVMMAFGDYSMTAERGLLIEHKGDAHTTGQADLLGVRLAVSNEISAGKRLDAGVVKSLTGGDPVKARKMHKDNIEFAASHTVLLVTNHKPAVDGGDAAMWRRLRLIPFDVRVSNPDTGLKEKLELELPAILAWLVRGYAEWKARGLCDPPAVMVATDEYKASSDAVGRFLDERCYLGGPGYVRARELFGAWQSWAHENGESAGSEVGFAESTRRRGLHKVKRSFGAVYTGVGLLAAENATNDPNATNG